MANTYTLISSYTASGSVANIDFTSIPATYTDLIVMHSIRTDRANYTDGVQIRFNGDSGANYTDIALYGYGTGNATSKNSAVTWVSAGKASASTATASVFGNSYVYIPNYTSAYQKSISADGVSENNSSSAWDELDAGIWTGTTTINRITLYPALGTNFVQYSTAYLYGVNNA